MSYYTLDQADLRGKRVFLRAGFDVSIEDGRVTDATRIEELVPTMLHILNAGASLVIAAHQGRPNDAPDPECSQKPLVPVLEKLLNRSIQFAESCIGPATEALTKSLKPGDVLLLENLRFHPGEKKNDPAFAEQLARLADLYVNDAFTNSHRAHASMVGVPALLPSFMGLQLAKEVAALGTIFDDPRRPMCLIVSGAKMETKIPVIENFLKVGDEILLGGCIANTFIAAEGHGVGQSKFEPELLEKAQELLLLSQKEDCATIRVPRDVVVADAPSDDAKKLDLPVDAIVDGMAAFDIGSKTASWYSDIIGKAGMVIWNGPLGMYEHPPFAQSSITVAKAIAKRTKTGAPTIIGGGDTIDLHHRYNLPLDAYTFVSTGGGAMMEFIAGNELPGLKVLDR